MYLQIMQKALCFQLPATISEETSYSVFCDREILYFGFLTCTTMAVLITQATILNFYIIAFFRGYIHHVQKCDRFASN